MIMSYATCHMYLSILREERNQAYTVNLVSVHSKTWVIIFLEITGWIWQKLGGDTIEGWQSDPHWSKIG